MEGTRPVDIWVASRVTEAHDVWQYTKRASRSTGICGWRLALPCQPTQSKPLDQQSFKNTCTIYSYHHLAGHFCRAKFLHIGAKNKIFEGEIFRDGYSLFILYPNFQKSSRIIFVGLVLSAKTTKICPMKITHHTMSTACEYVLIMWFLLHLWCFFQVLWKTLYKNSIHMRSWDAEILQEWN